MIDTTIAERVAVLEAQREQTSKDIDALHGLLRKSIYEGELERDELKTLVGSIKETQTQQKSFLGGVVFVISSLWAAAITAWNVLKD